MRVIKTEQWGTSSWIGERFVFRMFCKGEHDATLVGKTNTIRSPLSLLAPSNTEGQRRSIDCVGTVPFFLSVETHFDPGVFGTVTKDQPNTHRTPPATQKMDRTSVTKGTL